jgi:SAM-dependent methyltransferase
MSQQREMPWNWDDHAGWEAFYSGAVEAAAGAKRPLPYGNPKAIRFARWLFQRGYRKLWFAGCGLDGATRIYASLGCRVWATDVAPSAIAYQQLLADRPFDALPGWMMDFVRHSLPDLKEWEPGELTALVHDFRQPFPEPDFDCILNIRSFQGLPPESLTAAARVFFAALRPGGHAFFDTQNVQGEWRDVLEDALLEAGFVIPGVGPDRWYRHAIADAGIRCNLVLGRAILADNGERYAGPDGEARRAADEELLRTLTEELRERHKSEADATRQIWDDPTVRTADVVYNTG